VDSTVYFDVDADGYKEQTAWAGPADGLLVIDLAANGAPGADGKIDQAMEIAFARWTAAADTDLEALASVFDTNHRLRQRRTRRLAISARGGNIAGNEAARLQVYRNGGTRCRGNVGTWNFATFDASQTFSSLN
jgi:hypothetical protein